MARRKQEKVPRVDWCLGQSEVLHIFRRLWKKKIEEVTEFDIQGRDWRLRKPWKPAGIWVVHRPPMRPALFHLID